MKREHEEHETTQPASGRRGVRKAEAHEVEGAHDSRTKRSKARSPQDGPLWKLPSDRKDWSGAPKSDDWRRATPVKMDASEPGRELCRLVLGPAWGSSEACAPSAHASADPQVSSSSSSSSAAQASADPEPFISAEVLAKTLVTTLLPTGSMKLFKRALSRFYNEMHNFPPKAFATAATALGLVARHNVNVRKGLAAAPLETLGSRCAEFVRIVGPAAFGGEHFSKRWLKGKSDTNLTRVVVRDMLNRSDFAALRQLAWDVADECTNRTSAVDFFRLLGGECSTALRCAQRMNVVAAPLLDVDTRSSVTRDSGARDLELAAFFRAFCTGLWQTTFDPGQYLALAELWRSAGSDECEHRMSPVLATWATPDVVDGLMMAWGGGPPLPASPVAAPPASGVQPRGASAVERLDLRGCAHMVQAIDRLHEQAKDLARGSPPAASAAAAQRPLDRLRLEAAQRHGRLLGEAATSDPRAAPVAFQPHPLFGGFAQPDIAPVLISGFIGGLAQDQDLEPALGRLFNGIADLLREERWRGCAGRLGTALGHAVRGSALSPAALQGCMSALLPRLPLFPAADVAPFMKAFTTGLGAATLGEAPLHAIARAVNAQGEPDLALSSVINVISRALGAERFRAALLASGPPRDLPTVEALLAPAPSYAGIEARLENLRQAIGRLPPAPARGADLSVVSAHDREVARLWLALGAEQAALDRNAHAPDLAAVQGTLAGLLTSLQDHIPRAEAAMTPAQAALHLREFQDRKNESLSPPDWMHDAVVLGWRLGLGDESAALPLARAVVSQRAARLLRLANSRAPGGGTDPVLVGLFAAAARPPGARGSSTGRTEALLKSALDSAWSSIPKNRLTKLDDLPEPWLQGARGATEWIVRSMATVAEPVSVGTQAGGHVSRQFAFDTPPWLPMLRAVTDGLDTDRKDAAVHRAGDDGPGLQAPPSNGVAVETFLKEM